MNLIKMDKKTPYLFINIRQSIYPFIPAKNLFFVFALLSKRDRERIIESKHPSHNRNLKIKIKKHHKKFLYSYYDY